MFFKVILHINSNREEPH